MAAFCMLDFEEAESGVDPAVVVAVTLGVVGLGERLGFFFSGLIFSSLGFKGGTLLLFAAMGFGEGFGEAKDPSCDGVA